ncbi:MAG: hypothetical protein R3324_15040, partial [Halobacteriales archaeon]|nr:hypothetical protein [Halobacteriales archaeon]
MATNPTFPSQLEELPDEGEVFQVDTDVTCDETGVSAVIDSQKVPLGSVIIAPPGSKAVLAGSAAIESASSSSSSGATAIAGHAARLTSSAFTVPAPNSGSIFTFTSPFANQWAAPGLVLWFPAYGFIEVVANSGDNISAKNLSIPDGANLPSGVGFHIGIPTNFLVETGIASLFANKPDTLAVSSEVVIKNGANIEVGRIPKFPDNATVRFGLTPSAIYSLTGTDNLNEALTQPFNVFANVPAEVPAHATHLIVQGTVDINMQGTVTNLAYDI